MSAAKAPQRRESRPRLSLVEKRAIAELALRKGASLRAVAQEHGICRNSVRRWVSLHRAGKLGIVPAARSGAAIATFVPVKIAASARAIELNRGDMAVVELRVPSGASLRIEGGSLDTALICALVAQLQR